jgi:hypothetical protein
MAEWKNRIEVKWQNRALKNKGFLSLISSLSFTSHHMHHSSRTLPPVHHCRWLIPSLCHYVCCMLCCQHLVLPPSRHRPATHASSLPDNSASRPWAQGRRCSLCEGEKEEIDGAVSFFQLLLLLFSPRASSLTSGIHENLGLEQMLLFLCFVNGSEPYIREELLQSTTTGMGYICRKLVTCRCHSVGFLQ